jgi:hypothetical protein
VWERLTKRARAVTLSIPCEACEKVAAVLELLPAGWHTALSPDSDAFVIRGFVGVSSESVGALSAELRQALERGNVPQLHALNPQWAPFYCEACARSYCIAHWNAAPRFDDEGFTDGFYGSCPAGHDRMLDD